MQIPEIRTFNSLGNSKFISLIGERPADLIERVQDLAFDDAYTRKESLSTPFDVPKTRLDLGKALYKYIGPAGVMRSFSGDPALWNWLAAALMPALLGNPADFSMIKATERWVLNQASFKYYRHLLAGAYFAYEAHAAAPEKAMAILCQDILTPGEIVGQIQGTDDLAYSVGAEVATLLYYDANSGKVKPGAGGKGAGSVRRLASDFLNQIRVTVDFKGMSAQEIVELLPSEFDRFRADKNASVVQSDTETDFDALRGQLGN